MFIVIGQTKQAFAPRILHRSEDEDKAKQFAREHHVVTLLDIAVYDLNSGLQVYNLTIDCSAKDYEGG